MRTIDNELNLVKNMSIEDMALFPLLPYNFNCPLVKEYGVNSHPFAYINLDFHNREIAKHDLLYVNSIVCNGNKLSSLIPRNIYIPVSDVIFEPRNKMYGYTKLLCTPHTNSGRLAKHPVHLTFMTDLSKLGNNSHGELFYGADGKVSKATINIWKNGFGYFFKLITVNGTLVIKEISSTVKAKPNGLPDIIYKR